VRTQHRKDSTNAAAVLRDVKMHPAPHALQRPGSLIAPTLGKVQPPPANRTETAFGSLDASRTSESYRRGFAEGRAEGVTAGRELEALEGHEALQSAGEEARRQGFESGREEGLSRGRQDALAEAAQVQAEFRQEAEQALAERMRRLDQLIASLVAMGSHERGLAEEDMLALSFEALCRIVGKEASSIEMLRAVIRHLLSEHGKRTQLVVHVHPGDFEMLSAAQATSSPQSWRFVADDAVQLGGVILHSAEGTLDARLENQLAALRDVLVNTRNSRGAQLRQAFPGTASVVESAP